MLVIVHVCDVNFIDQVYVRCSASVAQKLVGLIKRELNAIGIGQDWSVSIETIAYMVGELAYDEEIHPSTKRRVKKFLTADITSQNTLTVVDNFRFSNKDYCLQRHDSDSD